MVYLSDWRATHSGHCCQSGGAGLRLIFGVLTLSKVMLSAIWQESTMSLEVPQPVYHTAARRREEAIIVHEINVHRLTAEGYCVL